MSVCRCGRETSDEKQNRHEKLQNLYKSSVLWSLRAGAQVRARRRSTKNRTHTKKRRFGMWSVLGMRWGECVGLAARMWGQRARLQVLRPKRDLARSAKGAEGFLRLT